MKELAEKTKDAFQTYRLTLDNVDQAQLIKESTFSKEQTTGMRLASNANASTDDDEPAPAENSQFVYGIEPVKLETINIMRDWIELSSHQPQTANAGEAKKPSGR